MGTPDPASDAGVTTIDAKVDWGFLTLGPSDVVRVTVQDHPELSTLSDGVRVDPQGYILLPEVGPVRLRGLTITEANQQLEARYGEILRRPSITAEVLDYSSRSYTVLGHFARPGVQFMDRPVTALEATAMGGALLPGTDRERLFLLRPHGDRLEVHRFSVKRPGLAGLVQIRPGDIIFARPTGAWNFQEGMLPTLAGLGFEVRSVVETPLVR
jgi:polysaccharide biosynthesis/export protein